MAKIIPSFYNKNQKYFAFVIIEFVVQKFTRHISFHVGMIHIQSIYDKNSMKFSSNIKKSINIVKYQIYQYEYQIYQYDTYNTYALTKVLHIFDVYPTTPN